MKAQAGIEKFALSAVGVEVVVCAATQLKNGCEKVGVMRALDFQSPSARSDVTSYENVRARQQESEM